MATPARSLLDLPDELLYSILSFSQVPPCEVPSATRISISSVLHVSRRLRHVAFELFTKTHTVLCLSSPKDRYLISVPNNPIDRFIKNVSQHLIEIPCHWKSIHPRKPTVLRFDVDLDTNFTQFAYLLERRERDFICSTHGLTSLLHLYQKPSYSQLTLSLEYIGASSRSRLFCTILDWFQPSSNPPLSNPAAAGQEAQSIPKSRQLVGRPLLDRQADEFADMLKRTLHLTRFCIQSNDFGSAISIMLYFGLPLLNQLPRVAPRWLWTHASRSVFPQLAWPNWKTNTRLATIFEITRLATHVLCCAYLAYCVGVEEGNIHWVQAHPMVVDQHYLIENFGMSASEIAEFDFVVLLQWIYSCKARSYTTGSQELFVQLLKQLRDAYQAGGCLQIHAHAYKHVAAALSAQLAEQIPLPEHDLDSHPIEYVDVDGAAQIWNGSHEDWKSWQIPLAEDQNEPRSRYLSRAQELYHRGESFDDLITTFLERFCEIDVKK